MNDLTKVESAAARMRAARREQQQARARLRAEVQVALDSGATVAAVTRAAGWSQRASVYNLIREGKR